MRITDKDIDLLVVRLNNFKVGKYYIDRTDKGIVLYKKDTTYNVSKDVFSCGHITKRELYYRIDAMLIGIVAKDMK